MARASQVPGISVQTFHASRIMEVATPFKVQLVELSITCMKSLRASPGLDSRKPTCIVWTQLCSSSGLVKKLPSFYSTPSFMTLFTVAFHWILSWGNWTPPTSSHPILVRLLLIFTFHSHLGHQIRLVSSSIPTKRQYVFLVHHIGATSTAHLIINVSLVNVYILSSIYNYLIFVRRNLKVSSCSHSVTVDLETIFHATFVGMFIFYFRKKVCIPHSCTVLTFCLDMKKRKRGRTWPHRHSGESRIVSKQFISYGYQNGS
jgi:hypothetical protein